jgi:mRNA interferase RelE/StbE
MLKYPVLVHWATAVCYSVAENIAIRYNFRMKRVVYSKAAEKSLDRMQPKRRQAIRAKVDAYARGETVDIKRLVGSDLFRIRVGDDRVIVDDQGMIVMVINAGPRGGIYKE